MARYVCKTYETIQEPGIFMTLSVTGKDNPIPIPKPKPYPNPNTILSTGQNNNNPTYKKKENLIVSC